MRQDLKHMEIFKLGPCPKSTVFGPAQPQDTAFFFFFFFFSFLLTEILQRSETIF